MYPINVFFYNIKVLNKAYNMNNLYNQMDQPENQNN